MTCPQRPLRLRLSAALLVLCADEVLAASRHAQDPISVWVQSALAAKDLEEGAGKLLQAYGLSEDPEHHYDPGEGGHHDDNGRQEGERGHQRQHLQGQAVLLTAIRHGLDGQRRHAVLGQRQRRAEDQEG